MGLFDKLFSGKKSKSASKGKNKQQQRFLTNSESFGFGDLAFKISGKIRVDGILAISAFENLAKERNLPFEFGAMYATLLEEGALTVPVVIRMGDQNYSLYFIYEEEDLLKYKDLVKHVGRTKFPNLIYFSAIPIDQGLGTKSVIQPFQIADLRHEKNTRLTGQFAMWWRSDSDPTFHNSKTNEHLIKIYETIKGYETYLAGYVLRQTKIQGDSQLRRMTLPETNISYVLHAPENKKVILDISQEKGIRFLFPTDHISKEYRERFLKGALADFRALKASLQQKNLEVDELLNPNGFDWFAFMSRQIKEMELVGKEIETVGGVAF